VASRPEARTSAVRSAPSGGNAIRCCPWTHTVSAGGEAVVENTWLVLPDEHCQVWMSLVPLLRSRHWLPPVTAMRSSPVRYQRCWLAPGWQGYTLLGVPLVELAPALRQLPKSSTKVWGSEADHISYNSVPVSRTEGLSPAAMSQSTLAPPKDVHENTVTEVISLGLYTPRHYGF
jgi:hypothetical protein